MIGLIQRVKKASVTVDGATVGAINKGILLFLGVEKDDDEKNIEKLARKVVNYRIFSDENDKMNLSLLDIKGQLLVVSQFTLVADTKSGNRPSFSNGASAEDGKRLYQAFIEHIEQTYMPCESGSYQADMQVSLINDGPVTFRLQF